MAVVYGMGAFVHDYRHTSCARYIFATVPANSTFSLWATLRLLQCRCGKHHPPKSKPHTVLPHVCRWGLASCMRSIQYWYCMVLYGTYWVLIFCSCLASQHNTGSTGLLALMGTLTFVTNLSFIAVCYLLKLMGDVSTVIFCGFPNNLLLYRLTAVSTPEISVLLPKLQVDVIA